MMGLLKNNIEEPTIVLQCTSLPSRNQATEVKNSRAQFKLLFPPKKSPNSTSSSLRLGGTCGGKGDARTTMIKV
jgi:hypothetical protein